MAYTYSDYITETNLTTRETKLRAHIKEVSDLITASVTKGGSSRTVAELKAMRTELMGELRELVAVNKSRGGGRAHYARVGEP